MGGKREGSSTGAGWGEEEAALEKLDEGLFLGAQKSKDVAYFKKYVHVYHQNLASKLFHFLGKKGRET